MSRDAFFAQMAEPFTGEALFDHVKDIVYFVKDAGGRYIAVNQTLVERCGKKNKAELIGCTAVEVFPAPLGEQINVQDLAVAGEGKVIAAQLELHLYPGGNEGWCLTWKHPIADRKGNPLGLSGISRDLYTDSATPPDMTALSQALDYLQANLDATLKVTDIAAQAGLSVYQMDQRMTALHGLSTAQFITRARIDLACQELKTTNTPISEIALRVGYGDQTAFTRQFRKSVGLTPRAYRER